MKANANPTCKCGKKFKRYTSLQNECVGCLATKVRRERERGDRKALKIKKAESRAFRKKVHGGDLGYQHGLTKDVFNRMRVLEEKLWFKEHGLEPYCISCGKANMDWSCGHFKTVGSQGNLRYDRVNTYLQCNWACNRNLSGNINGNKNSVGYKQGLRDRFGQEEGQRIIDYCDSHTQPVKWTCEYLIRFRAECAARFRDLEPQLMS